MDTYVRMHDAIGEVYFARCWPRGRVMFALRQD